MTLAKSRQSVEASRGYRPSPPSCGQKEPGCWLLLHKQPIAGLDIATVSVAFATKFSPLLRLNLLQPRLPIFCTVAEPRNSGKSTKFTKTRKIPQTLVKILSNTCLYNIFETYFSYRGYLLAVNLQIYLGTSSLKRANNVPIMLRKTGH